MKKLNINDIILNINNENLSFDNFNYQNNFTKSEIICKIHGLFYRTVKQIKNNILCDKCDDKIKSSFSFIKKSKEIHGDTYDYNETIYLNSRKKLKIKCNIHGYFQLLPCQHLRGEGCKICKIDKDINNNRNKFIQKSNLVHSNKYIYDNINYKNNKSYINIICKIHGQFKQRPDNHLNNVNGCPKCSLSKNERIIESFLIKNNINYKTQYSFENCKLKLKLRFDFYLPDINTCIEFNGIQHYKPVEYFGGIKTLEYNLKKDLIKENYCNKNNIKLILIKYFENVELKLYEELIKI